MTENDQHAKTLSLIWDVQPPRPRGTVPLDRERIVLAAITVADQEGLDAVTLRRVASELGSSPMSLYRHLPGGKEDLIALMLDHVLGEHELTGIPSGDWAADLTQLATQRRDAAHRHRWSVVPAARPTLGPHGMRRLDTALAVFGDAPWSAEQRAWAVGVLDAYVTGAVSQELAQANEQTRTGVSDQEWQEAVAPYVARMLSTGAFPHLEAYINDAPPSDPAEQFRTGLASVISGILRSAD